MLYPTTQVPDSIILKVMYKLIVTTEYLILIFRSNLYKY